MARIVTPVEVNTHQSIYKIDGADPPVPVSVGDLIPIDAYGPLHERGTIIHVQPMTLDGSELKFRNDVEISIWGGLAAGSGPMWSLAPMGLSVGNGPAVTPPDTEDLYLLVTFADYGTERPRD
jgi:hypothetical protein